VKIRKPDDEKFFKDVVLNDILDEISNEDGVASNNKPHPRKKNTFGKTLLYLVIGFTLVLFVVILFRFVGEATTAKTIEKPIPQKIVPELNDTQEWKMEEDRSDYQKPVPPKVVQEKAIIEKAIIEKPVIKMEIKKDPVKLKPVPIQKTEREIAKESLRQQMLN